MDDDKLFFPEITLETDDIIMNIAVKKDYSQIENIDDRKKEFIGDLKDFIEEFAQAPESKVFLEVYD